MKKQLLLVAVSLIGVVAMAQNPATPGSATSPAAATTAAAIVITANTTPIELARAALAAQGGDKFKNMKSIMLTGTVDLYAPNSTQSVPGKFVMITAGERVRIDVDARPLFSFKQIADGDRSYSSMPGVSLPPISRFGLPVLAKFDQPGYTVSALPDKKKLRGFRIADGDGDTTDFYVDPAIGRVMSYVTPYNGYTFGTENSKMKEVDGVLVPFSFSQRLESQMGAFFAEYKVKDVKVNGPIADDVFTIPN
jgi:hypothetical protein